MKSEAVPAADTELKKEECLSGEQKVAVTKENAAPVETESTATVVSAVSAPNDDVKMVIDEPTKVEKETPANVKDSDETAELKPAPNAPIEDVKMEIDEPTKVEEKSPVNVKESDETTTVASTTTTPLEDEQKSIARTDIQSATGQTSPINPISLQSVPVTATAPVVTAPSIDSVAKPPPVHSENILPAPAEPNVNDTVPVSSQNTPISAATPTIQTSAPNVYGYYPTPYLPPPLPSQYYPPIPSQYYPGPYQAAGYSPYFHSEPPSQNPPITTQTPATQTSAQNVVISPTSQSTPLTQIPASGPTHPGQSMPPTGAVSSPPPHASNPNPHAGLPAE